jgi:hypothetical protein
MRGFLTFNHFIILSVLFGCPSLWGTESLSVSSIYPDLGPPGQWVYVHGSGFLEGQTTITIGGIGNVQASVYGSKQLGFTVPIGATGVSVITVTTPYGSVSSSHNYTVGIPVGAPTVTGFSPNLGPPGQWVYVFGSNFVHGNTFITFAGKSGIEAMVYGPDQLGFYIPQGSGGFSRITVTTPNGQMESTEGFAIGIPQDPPIFTRLHEYEGFNWVYLDGANFVYGDTTVRFNNTDTIQAHVYGPSSLGFTPPLNWRSAQTLRIQTPNGHATVPLSKIPSLDVRGSRSKYYRIQRSTNLKEWIYVSEPIQGENSALRIMFNFSDRPSEFYRLEEQ